MQKALCAQAAKIVAGMLLCLALLPGRQAPAQDNQTTAAAQPPAAEPHLSFTRSLMTKPFQGGQAYVAQHTVRPGEHLWKILRDEYQMSDSRIAFYCRIAKDVNKKVPDLNLLVPDQHILIPYKYVGPGPAGILPERGSGTDATHVVRAGEHFGSIMRSRYQLPDHVLFSQQALRRFRQANPGLMDVNLLEQGQTITIPAALFEAGIPAAEQAAPLPSRPPVRAAEPDVPAPAPAGAPQQDPGGTAAADAALRGVLATVTRSLGGTDNSTGSQTVDLPGSGTLTLDHAQYPVYAFPGGKKIVLDIGSTLPSDVRQVIASSWQDTEVLAVHDRADLEAILDKVLDASGFYRVEKQGAYIMRRDDIQISISGQWIIFKDKMMKSVVIVNLVDPDESTVPAAFKSYLEDLGLKMVDVRPGLSSAAQGQHKAAEPGQEIPAQPAIAGSGSAAAADIVLDMLGITCEKEYRTNIFQNVYSGISLEVVVDRMFRRNGTTYLIDFQGLPPTIAAIIREQGMNLLTIDPHQQQEPLRTAQQILELCGVAYSGPPANLEHAKAKQSNIKLMVPGILFKVGARSVLLTTMALQPSIIQLIADFDVHIVKL